MNIAVKIILVYYCILNFVLLTTMAIDKMRAKKQQWRVPESTLFIMALLGGAVGGFCGMFWFHHKTQKPQFYIIYSIALLLHLSMLAFIFTKFIKLSV